MHERARTAPQHALADVAFPARYAGVFATAGGADVRLWALATRRELLRLREPGLACACVAFTAGGGAVVSGWSDGAVRAYGPQSGAPAFAIRDAHQAGVTALAPAAGGGQLVTGGGDGTVRSRALCPWPASLAWKLPLLPLLPYEASKHTNDTGVGTARATAQHPCAGSAVWRGALLHG